MSTRFVIFQTFLCMVLLVCLIIVRVKGQNSLVPVSAFGKKDICNETLFDFCNNVYGDLFYE